MLLDPDVRNVLDEELEGLDLSGETLVAPQPRGTVILFPSFCLHRVKPVTRGSHCRPTK